MTTRLRLAHGAAFGFFAIGVLCGAVALHLFVGTLGRAADLLGDPLPWALGSIVALSFAALARIVLPLALCLPLLAAALLAAPPAWAMDAAGAGGLVEELLVVLGGFLVGVVGVLGRAAIGLAKRKLELDIDEATRAYLQEALERAADYGWRRVAGVPSAQLRGTTPEAEALHHAVEYARERVPDALRRFGIDDQGLARMLQTRMTGREHLGDAGPTPAEGFGAPQAAGAGG